MSLLFQTASIAWACAALGAGCAAPQPANEQPDSGASDTVSSDSASADTADSGAPVTDADGDGHDGAAAGGDDCDDSDASVSPSQAEVDWNTVDDDCDGRVDADGSYSGTFDLAASAVYEGRTYSYVVPCVATVDRTLGQVSLAVVCTPDLEEDEASRLLGAELTVAPTQDPLTVEAEGWAGLVEFTSSNGWDTRGDGSLAWADRQGVQLGLALEAASLTAAGGGVLAWTGAR